MRIAPLTFVLCSSLVPFATSAAPGDVDFAFGQDGKTVTAIDLAAPFSDDLIDTVTAPNGQIYLIGTARMAGGRRAIAVRRLHPDGAPDLTYGEPVSTGGIVVLSANPNLYSGMVPVGAALDGEGQLTIAATGSNVDSSLTTVLCQLDVQGIPFPVPMGVEIGNGCMEHVLVSQPEKFVNPRASGIALDNDGRILVLSTGVAKGRQVAVVNRRAQGAFYEPDKAFPHNAIVSLPNTDVVGQDIDVQASGRIVVGATSRPINSTNQDFLIAGLKDNGVSDLSFNGTGFKSIAFDKGGNKSDQLKAIEVLPDNSIIAAGSARIDASSSQFAVAKLTSAGTTHFGFGQQGKIVHIFCDVCLQAPLADMTVQTNGRIVLTGSATGQGFSDIGVMRLLSNGAPDLGFGDQARVFVGFEFTKGQNAGNPAKSSGASVSLQNGNVVVGGSAETDSDNLSNKDYVAVRLLAN